LLERGPGEKRVQYSAGKQRLALGFLVGLTLPYRITTLKLRSDFTDFGAGWGGESNHSPITDALRKSTLRAGAGAAKAALHILILCLILDQSREKREKEEGP
jgi:hypothetical protein